MRCRLLVASLGALLMVAAGACMTKPSAAPILLSCTGAGATDETVVDALCDALAAEIAARVPERPLLRSSRNEVHPPGTWDGVLEVVRTRTDFWEGRLIWRVVGQESNAKRKVGPFVQTSSMDAPLGSRAYRRFARGILKVSRPLF